MRKNEIVAWCVAGVSVGCAVLSYIQHKKTASLLKKTVSEAAAMTPVEIEKEVVDEVVQEALEMKVDSQVDDILDETRKEISNEITRIVYNAVQDQLNNARSATITAYEKELADISMDDVKDCVTKRASDIIEEKLEDQMDDILRQYERRLDDFNSMYTRMLSKAPNLTLASNVTPGIHVNL